jgi:hypothetical protein
MSTMPLWLNYLDNYLKYAIIVTENCVEKTYYKLFDIGIVYSLQKITQGLAVNF